MSSPSLKSGCWQNSHGEEDLQLAGMQAAQGGLADVGGAGGVEGFGIEAAGTEALGHEAGVLHAHAEAQGAHAHAQGLGHLLLQLAEDQIHAAVVAGVEGAELGGLVAAAAPFQGGEIGGVGHGEIVEGGEQALIEGAPETQLGADAAVEPVEDVEPVGALGSGGEAEQQLGSVSCVDQGKNAQLNSISLDIGDVFTDNIPKESSCALCDLFNTFTQHSTPLPSSRFSSIRIV